jgi:hypothetical protein
MFIVKLIKYVPNEGMPASTVHECIRETDAIHVTPEAKGPRRIIQFGDAPSDICEYTIGPGSDCSFTVAFVMNMQGKTIETIR